MVMGFGADATLLIGGQNCQLTPPSSPDNSQPDTLAIVLSYINFNDYFLSNFTLSSQKLLSVGYGPGGKLGGPLLDLDLSACE